MKEQRRTTSIAQWICLRLPSCGLWFKSQAQHPPFFKLYLKCEVKRAKIKGKEAVIGQHLKK